MKTFTSNLDWRIRSIFHLEPVSDGILGLRFGKFMKGLYNNGHERNDVVRYRNAFLERMAVYEKRMVQYVGEFMETKISPESEDGTRPLVIVTHDGLMFWVELWQTLLLARRKQQGDPSEGQWTQCHGFRISI